MRDGSPLKRAEGRGGNRPYKDRPSRIKPRLRGFGRNGHQAGMCEVEPGSGVSVSTGSQRWLDMGLDMGGEFALLTEQRRYNRHGARRDRGS